MQIIGLSVSVNRSPHRIRSQAQHKHGQDVWRSMYYRQDWGQPWQQVARAISRLKRWTLRKFTNPPSLYRKLNAAQAPERPQLAG